MTSVPDCARCLMPKEDFFSLLVLLEISSSVIRPILTALCSVMLNCVCVCVCVCVHTCALLLHPADVKPSNVLINTQGQVKMCDFGISGYLVDSVAKTMDAGCKPYMAVSLYSAFGDNCTAFMRKLVLFKIPRHSVYWLGS